MYDAETETIQRLDVQNNVSRRSVKPRDYNFNCIMAGLVSGHAVRHNELIVHEVVFSRVDRKRLLGR